MKWLVALLAAVHSAARESWKLSKSQTRGGKCTPQGMAAYPQRQSSGGRSRIINPSRKESRRGFVVLSSLELSDKAEAKVANTSVLT